MRIDLRQLKHYEITINSSSYLSLDDEFLSYTYKKLFTVTRDWYSLDRWFQPAETSESHHNENATLNWPVLFIGSDPCDWVGLERWSDSNRLPKVTKTNFHVNWAGFKLVADQVPTDDGLTPKFNSQFHFANIWSNTYHPTKARTPSIMYITQTDVLLSYNI